MLDSEPGEHDGAAPADGYHLQTQVSNLHLELAIFKFHL
jgi:hypothetical protein